MPIGPAQGYAVWPPMATEDELTTAELSSDGKHVKGWVMVPEGTVWKPEDLLWLPPSATKSTDLDAAGRIVDVVPDAGEIKAFVTAELAKHERYLDLLRAKVRAGGIKLTAFLAKMLGMAFEDGVELTPRLLRSAYRGIPAAAALKAFRAED